MALQAISEKKGLPLIVFKRESGAVKRLTLAPKFKHGRALAAKGSTPVCLVLEASHYRFLAPAPGVAIPQAWLRDNLIDLPPIAWGKSIP